MLDLWNFADFLPLRDSGYVNGAVNIPGALYHIDNMYKSGVRIIILTPQFDYGDGATNALRLAGAETLCGGAKRRYPGLRICIGSRIKYYSGAAESVGKGIAVGICGGRYVFLEFDRDAAVSFIRDGVKEFFAAGYRPLIENPLCYDEVDMDILELIVQDGAYTVWDTAVFEGKLHRSARRQLDALFTGGLMHFVSDGAGGAAVTDYTAPARNAALMYGDDAARALFYDNYIEVVSNGINIKPS